MRPESGRRHNDRRAGGVGGGQVNQIDAVEPGRGHRYRVTCGLQQPADGATAGVLDARNQWRRPGEYAAAVGVAHARITSELVEHQHVSDAISVEVSRREEFSRSLIDESSADGKG